MMYNYLRDKLLLFKSKKILGFLSFIESIFFPIPTDVLLIPMSMSKSYKWIDLVALKHTSGDRTRMAHKLLEDYRNQMLGKIALEVPI